LALVAMISGMPLALAPGEDSEPPWTAVIGALITSTLLTLFVVAPPSQPLHPPRGARRPAVRDTEPIAAD
jgi:Cu/Ag efflux pump CusA